MYVIQKRALAVAAILALAGQTACTASTPPATKRPSSGAPASDAVTFSVGFDSRVELLYILSRLAGAPEHSAIAANAYVRDVDAYFGRYRSHAAVLASRQLVSRGAMRYDAPAALALQLTADSFRLIRAPAKRGTLVPDSRWSGVDIPAYVRTLRRFAVDTHFDQFLARHKDGFRQATQRYRAVVNGLGILDWMIRNVGPQLKARHVVVLSFLIGDDNYAPRTQSVAGRLTLYQILGVRLDKRGEPHVSRVSTAGTLFHEVAHSYINPLVWKHRNAFADVARRIFARDPAAWKKRGYGNWISLMNESCVRALTSLYMADQFGPMQGMGWIWHENRQGFPWTGALVSTLRDLRKTHGPSLSLSTSLPRLADALAGWERANP